MTAHRPHRLRTGRGLHDALRVALRGLVVAGTLFIAGSWGAQQGLDRLAQVSTSAEPTSSGSSGLTAESMLTWVMIFFFLFTAVLYISYRVDTRNRRRAWENIAYQRKRLWAARNVLDEEANRRGNQRDVVDGCLDEDAPDDD